MTGNDNYNKRDAAGDALRFVVAGFGMGILVGAAVGLLLAPKSGRETREHIREFATEFGTKAKSAATDFSERARVAASSIGDQATGTYDRVSEKAKVAVADAADKARKMSDTIAETASTVKDVTGKISQAAREGYKKTMEELQAEADELSTDLEDTLQEMDKGD